MAYRHNAPLLARADEQTHQGEYLKIYLKINEGDQLQKQGDYSGRADRFQGLLRPPPKNS